MKLPVAPRSNRNTPASSAAQRWRISSTLRNVTGNLPSFVLNRKARPISSWTDAVHLGFAEISLLSAPSFYGDGGQRKRNSGNFLGLARRPTFIPSFLLDSLGEPALDS